MEQIDLDEQRFLRSSLILEKYLNNFQCSQELKHSANNVLHQLRATSLTTQNGKLAKENDPNVLAVLSLLVARMNEHNIPKRIPSSRKNDLTSYFGSRKARNICNPRSHAVDREISSDHLALAHNMLYFSEFVKVLESHTDFVLSEDQRKTAWLLFAVVASSSTIGASGVEPCVVPLAACLVIFFDSLDSSVPVKRRKFDSESMSNFRYTLMEMVYAFHIDSDRILECIKSIHSSLPEIDVLEIDVLNGIYDTKRTTSTSSVDWRICLSILPMADAVLHQTDDSAHLRKFVNLCISKNCSKEQSKPEQSLLSVPSSALDALATVASSAADPKSAGPVSPHGLIPNSAGGMRPPRMSGNMQNTPAQTSISTPWDIHTVAAGERERAIVWLRDLVGHQKLSNLRLVGSSTPASSYKGGLVGALSWLHSYLKEARVNSTQKSTARGLGHVCDIEECRQSNDCCPVEELHEFAVECLHKVEFLTRSDWILQNVQPERSNEHAFWVSGTLALFKASLAALIYDDLESSSKLFTESDVSKRKQTLETLYASVEFRKAVFLCCLQSCHAIVYNEKPSEFQFFAQCFSVLDAKPFDVSKLLKRYCKRITGLPTVAVYRLAMCQQQILDSLAWHHNSVVVSALQQPEQTPAMNIFIEMYLGLAGLRVRELGLHLRLDRPHLELIWDLFRCIVINHRELLIDRHMDQVILCCFYGISRVVRADTLGFRDILAVYRNMSHVRRPGNHGICPRIYRQVLIRNDKYADVIEFYNLVFMITVKQNLIQVAKSKSNPKASASSMASVMNNAGLSKVVMRAPLYARHTQNRITESPMNPKSPFLASRSAAQTPSTGFLFAVGGVTPKTEFNKNMISRSVACVKPSIDEFQVPDSQTRVHLFPAENGSSHWNTDNNVQASENKNGPSENRRAPADSGVGGFAAASLRKKYANCFVKSDDANSGTPRSSKRVSS
eukprot:CAMPEP_0182442870 /NCGR_PEP_ID=MMETSP1172-20130603/1734_1 /TAXON_ID=708627 /ORGANISM="Timspurckia oligopyrenoides, Strain CCMP3278" /LENGTH=955 /DNA_ID=CAMNT_0024637939 /DNA_START=52 /DNA_END=2919 /DNA_ORIENTATION=+